MALFVEQSYSFGLHQVTCSYHTVYLQFQNAGPLYIDTSIYYVQ